MDLMKTEIGVVLNRSRMMLHMRSIWLAVFSDPAFKTQILNWIRQDQLFKRGIDGDGDEIGVYSEFTEMINPEKIAGTHYTLFDSGEFYKSMFITIGIGSDPSITFDADPIKIDDDGEKTNLFWKYGENIIALTDENKTKLANEIRDRFIRESRKILFDNR
jgi:hypothetical protein